MRFGCNVVCRLHKSTAAGNQLARAGKSLRYSVEGVEHDEKSLAFRRGAQIENDRIASGEIGPENCFKSIP